MRISATPLELNASAQNDPGKIDKVSRQLEGQFAQMLVKSMRDASFGDSLFPGENQMFRDMYDQQMAKALTEGKGLGLSAMIARQLGGGADTGTGGGANTSINGSQAAKAYSLVAGRRDAATAIAATPTQSPMDKLLDMIAGRDASGAGQSGDVAGSALAWPSADDRWSQPGMAATGSASATASSAANAAVAELGERTPEGFVAKIWTHAQKAARELGVDPRALVAQAALETGWGRRGISRGNGGDSNNLFGIKATGWKGDSVTTGTHEYVNGVKTAETATFRAYRSAEESFADYVRLLKNNSRYQQALNAGTNIHGFARGLQKAGYATDPAYAAKIAAIATGPTIGRAVAAIGNAAVNLASSFASNADLPGSGAIRR
ncbi:MAG TPA: flagellar assembly peptidoglycan hydrolase FlgJ [Xanthomonadaceae bacterium]|nr:flagellar assembly peptidoglycan hydrolase FlgJ [Xanthomonadaceae bacterium]